MTKVEIRGERELNDVLRVLPKKYQGQVVVAGLKKASRPYKTTAKQLAPVRKGGKQTTKRAITTVTRSKNPAEVWTAPTKGRRVTYDAWYARFHEFGTSGFGKRKRISGRLTDTGQRVSMTTGYARRGTGLPAIKFMQKAFEQRSMEAKNLIKKSIQEATIKFLNKKLPKYAR